MTEFLARATRATLVAVIASTALISAASTASAGSPCATGTAEGDYCYTDDGSVATIVGYTGAGGDVVVPDTLGALPVTVVAMNVFASAGLTSVTLPATLVTIGDSAFQNNSITTLDVPASVTSIGTFAFVNNRIATLSLGDSLASIGPWAFANNSFTDLTLPASVTNIGDMAFRLFTLATVTMLGNEPTTLGASVFGPVDPSNDPLVTFADGKTYTHGVPGVWNAGGTNYRVVEPVTVTFVTPVGAAPATVHPMAHIGTADPGVLTAADYRFDGWYSAASGGSLIGLPVTVTGDMTLYAHWTQLFSATFSSPVGTAPAPVEVAIGDTLPDPGLLTADVHRFLGWFDAPTGGDPIVFPLTIAADTAVYAQWEARAVVAPADAGAGSSISVTGTGFEPGESVAIELHSTPVLLGTLVADSSGVISGTVTIPANAAAGSHSLVLTGSVTGVSSAGITISATLAATGTSPWPLALGAVALIGSGLILRRRAAR